MARFQKRKLLLGFAVFIALMLVGSVTLTSAQDPDDWFGDTHLQAYIAVNDVSITQTNQTTPILIDLEGLTTIDIAIDVVGTQAISNLTGALGFYYQSIKVFELAIGLNESVTSIPPEAPVTPVSAQLALGSYLETTVAGFEIDLITGQFEASVILYYWLEGEDLGAPPSHSIEQVFFLRLPPTDFLDAITSVAGIATAVATGGAVVGTAVNFKSLFDGIQTAHKVRSIQKKAGEIRSLPDLTVLGALPVLFSLVAGMVKVKKKKEAVEEDEGTSEGISAYNVRQSIREIAPDAWRKDICPKCRKKWKKDATSCQKCKIDIQEASEAYADLLVQKSNGALRLLGKKKSLSIRKIAKKTKSNEYNAGVIGAAFVDAGVVEITKVETPFRSFVMNIAGLAFLIITWQQLLGGSASQFQTTLTVVGGALSLGVIVALYFARKTQVQKLRVELDDQGIPITEEAPVQDTEEARAPAPVVDESIPEPEEVPEPAEEPIADSDVEEDSEDEETEDEMVSEDLVDEPSPGTDEYDDDGD
ncbi:MAG: hypothetical protein EAX95_07720 [Candidatus Thorarchaeota archaeon]|nr:hypothetical protein [Candidatus Thorarchaeota archaeon]